MKLFSIADVRCYAVQDFPQFGTRTSTILTCHQRMAENVAFNIFFGRGLRASGVEAARRGADSMRSHSLSWKVLREESRLTGGRTLQAGPAPPLWEAGQYAAPTLVNTTVGTKEIYRAAENNATVCPGQSTQTQTGAEPRCFSIIIICTRSLYPPIFRPLKKLLSRHLSVSAPSRQGHGLQRGQRAKTNSGKKKKIHVIFFHRQGAPQPQIVGAGRAAWRQIWSARA